MVTRIDVPDGIDSSIELQALIDKIGNRPAIFVFSPDHHIHISTQIQTYNGVEWSGNDCTFELIENASVKTFGEQIPLIRPKDPHNALNHLYHDINFFGNRDNQKNVPPKKNKRWGLGYFNTFTFGDIHSVSYSNSTNIELYNLGFFDSLGDGARFEGGRKCFCHHIEGSKGGHDVICYASVDGGEIHDLNIKTEVNAAVRLRSAKNVKVYDCIVDGSSDGAYCPGMQIQDTNNWDSSGLEIYNNDIRHTKGPGIQVVGDNLTNSVVKIHHNFFYGCGQMPAANDLPYTGAIIFDGFPVEIYNNDIIKSRGYGIAAAAFNMASKQKYAAKIYRNIVTGTSPANTAGTASGAAIANINYSRYSVSCEENCLWGNKTEIYKITHANGIYEDPLFIDSAAGNYNLKEKSPCRKSGYYIGKYGDTGTTISTPTKILISCSESDSEKIMQYKYPGKYEIFRRNSNGN